MTIAMKTLSATLTLLLFIIIMSIKSYSQSSDTVKYYYNASGSRYQRIIVLGEGGGKGMQQSDWQKKIPKKTRHQQLPNLFKIKHTI